jgi:hypothetical protein
MPDLAPWESFHLIGGAAGALVGARNSGDSISYHVYHQRSREDERGQDEAAEQ